VQCASVCVAAAGAPSARITRRRLSRIITHTHKHKTTHAQHRQTNRHTCVIFTRGLCRLADRGPSIWGGGPAVRRARVYPTTDGRTQTHSLATASRRSGGCGGGVCIGNEVLRQVTRRLRILIHRYTIIILYTSASYTYIMLYIFVYIIIRVESTGSVSCADLQRCIYCVVVVVVVVVVVGASARRFCF